MCVFGDWQTEWAWLICWLAGRRNGCAGGYGCARGFARCAGRRDGGRPPRSQDGLFVTSFEKTWSEVQTIDGWLTEGQGRMLYDAAQHVNAGEAIVEIGSHHGRSTVLLAQAKPADVELVAVDPFGDPRWGGGEDALQIFRANLAKHHVGDLLRLARQKGSEAGQAWTGPRVGMLFLDGAHDYHSVCADLAAWRPYLSPTGTVLMHDVTRLTASRGQPFDTCSLAVICSTLAPRGRSFSFSTPDALRARKSLLAVSACCVSCLGWRAI